MLKYSVNASSLSRWLRRSGTLPHGSVVELHVDLEIETDISRLAFVTAQYSADTPSGLPRHLVVKSPLEKSGGGDGSEVHFYQHLAPALGTPPLARCLAALDSSDADSETVVLEDLRAGYDHPPWPVPPSHKQCEMALNVLARVHARWWESPSLGTAIGQLHTSESLTAMVQGIASHLPGFFDALGDWVPRDARAIYERVFGSSLRPWLRLSDPRALTVIHGDAHTWNFLFPRSGQGAAFLIDWQLWHVDLGSRDLAFFIALHWYSSRRAELELPLLRYYYDGLLEQGVDSYSFEELWLDYRRCVVRNLTIPVLFWSRGMKPEGWWHRLECSLAAYRELGCDELL